MDPYTDATRNAARSGNNEPDAYSAALADSIPSRVFSMPNARGALEMLLAPLRAGASAMSVPIGYGRDALLDAFNSISGQPLYKDTQSGAAWAQDNLQRETERVKGAYAPLARDISNAIPRSLPRAPTGLSDNANPTVPDGALRLGLGDYETGDGPVAPRASPAPAPRRGYGAPRRVQGALSSVLPGTGPDIPVPPGTMDDEANDRMTSAGEMAPPEAREASAPAAPRKTLADQYRERRAGMTNADTGLTEQQKKDRMLEIGLSIMAAASRPGASALGAVGEGGLKGTAIGREMERLNIDQASKRRSEERDDAKTEIGFADKDADNERQGRAEERALLGQKEVARHHQAIEDIQKQAETGKMDRAAAALELKRIQVEYEGRLKEARIAAAGASLQAQMDKLPPEVRTLEYLMKNPGAMETFTKMKGGGRDRQEERIDQSYATYLQKRESDPMAAATPAKSRAEFSKGFSENAQTISRGDAVYQGYLKRPEFKNDRAKLDAALKARGYEVAD